MKQRIFNSGKGWYISATNYHDEKDKAYVNLYFPKNTEPDFNPNNKGYSAIDIDIIESKFTSYRGKVGLTVFKYELIGEYFVNTQDDMNANYDLELNPEDYPFY